MTIDPFKRILMNAGEQAIAADINNLQRQFHMHLFEMLNFPRMFNLGNRLAADSTTRYQWMNETNVGRDFFTSPDSELGTDVAWAPFPSCGMVRHDTTNARTLIVGGTPGPICQLVDNGTLLPGSTDFFLTYWMAQDEQSLVTAVGDATNPRIDIVEMKLELDDRDAETRVYGIAGVKAELDLDPTMTNVDTVIEARVAGEGGNNISIEFVADGTGAGSLTQSGWALTFHFDPTVTTVTDFETAVAASALVQVKTAGTGANIFASPGDVEPAVFLEGGVDTVLASQSIDKARRVVATFQIKQGTPNANPEYPTCTAGFVPVAGVFIPALHNTTHQVGYMRDMRMPLGGIKVYDVPAHQFLYNSAKWTYNYTKRGLIATDAAPDSVYAVCPVGGGTGRLVGLWVHGQVVTTAGSNFQIHHLYHGADIVDGFGDIPNGSANVITNPSSSFLDQISKDGADNYGSFMLGPKDIMDACPPATEGIRPDGTLNGTGIWTNGSISGPIADVFAGNPGLGWPLHQLGVMLLGDQNSDFRNVRFIIAHGID